MTMKRVLFLASCILAFHLAGFTQLTTRENVPSVIRTGTRPQPNNWAIYIGPSVTEVLDMVDKNVSWRGVPLVNLKYYQTDRLEWRLGLLFHGTREKEKGKLIDGGEKVEKVNMEFYNRLMPGVAYHFSPKNVVDVYVGGYLPIGLDRNKMIEKSGMLKNEVSQNIFTVGLEAFIGLQWFVADLPVSFGIEYGLSGLFQNGLRKKHVVSDGETTQTYYTSADEKDRRFFNSLKRNRFELGNDCRVSISYYFKN